MTKSLLNLSTLSVSLIVALPAVSALAHPDVTEFLDVVFVAAPEVLDCTLTDGTAAECYQFTVNYLPDDLKIGPFCPATLDDAGGLWDWTGDQAGLYQIDREFLELLNSLGYSFYNEDGTVNVITSGGAPDGTNSCMNLDADDTVTMTMLLPVTAVMADAPTELGTVAKVGVATDGIPIFADAPSIQERSNMPALDLCGGHIDPGGWYHWHATATDIDTVLDAADISASCNLPQDATALFGYAFDGFAIYGSQEADGSVPSDLDECQGHVAETADGLNIYHYHAGDTFPNLPTCLVGLQASDNFSTTASGGIGSQGGGPGGALGGGQGGLPPGFDEAATTLGISAEDLFAAVEAAGGRDAYLADVAQTLEIDEDVLRDAMPE
ncbi:MULTISPECIES: YHYH protein [Rhodobacterales]|uniref:YHYH protein n=1 Tax=Rhodobacterales TaxID=204455 RepID=UPI0015EFEDC2|nr:MULTISPECIES: YHYH protein [Rhodobacterales]MDO6592193.1 YHYH protein [Yoonia sp. 1_MG-2023]